MLYEVIGISLQDKYQHSTN